MARVPGAWTAPESLVAIGDGVAEITPPTGMEAIHGARRRERPCTIKEELRSGRVELSLGDPLARSAQKGLHLECRHRTCTRARETVGYIW